MMPRRTEQYSPKKVGHVFLYLLRGYLSLQLYSASGHETPPTFSTLAYPHS